MPSDPSDLQENTKKIEQVDVEQKGIYIKSMSISQFWDFFLKKLNKFHNPTQ